MRMGALEEARRTWVVGAACPFGYAVGLSDIRVTFPDGSEKDCLQKIYPVGQFIVAGFAGSVAIGFEMVSTLARLLYNPDQNAAWIPETVADWWPADARSVFEEFSDCEKRLGSQLMILEVHPTENDGGDAPCPKSEVYTFSSPRFELKRAQGMEVLSIGCGSQIAAYAQLLRDLSKMDTYIPFVSMGGRGVATGFAISLTSKLQDFPQPGISPHLHICLVSRGVMEIRTNDHDTFDAGTAHQFKMPTVATSYRDLLRLCQSEGTTANGAIC